MTALATFAEWIAAVPDDHDALAYERAQAAVLDTLACIIAGAGEPPAAKVRAAVASWGDGPCSVAGSGAGAAPPWAALVNGTAAHALDFDDYEDLGQSHPSAVLVPALLALGEARGASGRDLLDAYIVGLEVLMRTGEAINLSHYHLGWHATATLGAVGAAAAAARLLGLDPARAAAALGLSVSMAAGFKSQFGTMAKPLHAGLAAKAGVLSGCLAETGMTAAETVFDGTWSLLGNLAGADAVGFAGPLSRLGGPLALVSHGLVAKPYPCCGCTHRTLDGILELRRAHALAAEEIAAVTTRIPGRNAEILMYPAPENAMQARFSLEYCSSLAVLQGRLGPGDFTAAAVARPEVRAWLPRVTVERHPIGAHSDTLTAVEPDEVTLELAAGRRLAARVDQPRGSLARPMNGAERLAKLRSCIEGRLAEDAAAGLEAAVGDLAGAGALGAVTRYLTTPI